MHHSIERSSASAPSHHDLYLAAFITNIGPDFQHTGGNLRGAAEWRSAHVSPARIDPILANCTTLLQGARDNSQFSGNSENTFCRFRPPTKASRRSMRGTQEGKTVMIRFRSRMITAAGLLVGTLPTVAFAQLEETAERRAACMVDAIMLCSSAIPNKALIASCLASKMSQLSPQCRAQFVINSDLKGDSRRQSPSAAARQH